MLLFVLIGLLVVLLALRIWEVRITNRHLKEIGRRLERSIDAPIGELARKVDAKLEGNTLKINIILKPVEIEDRKRKLEFITKIGSPHKRK